MLTNLPPTRTTEDDTFRQGPGMVAAVPRKVSDIVAHVSRTGFITCELNHGTLLIAPQTGMSDGRPESMLPIVFKTVRTAFTDSFHSPQRKTKLEIQTTQGIS